MINAQTERNTVAVGYHLGACESTQPLAAAWVASSLDPGSRIGVVLASSQEAGAGRGDRAWVNGPGSSLLVSIGVRGPLRAGAAVGLDGRVAAALAEVLRRMCAVTAELKDPNDIVAGGAKLGGVLVDARTVGTELASLVVGVGANLGGGRFEVAGRSATTVEAEGGDAPEARLLVDELVPAVASLLGVMPLAPRWRQPARLWTALTSVTR